MPAPHIFQAQADNATLAFQITISYRGSQYSPDLHDEVITRLVRAYREIIAVHENPDDDLPDIDALPTLDTNNIHVDIHLDDEDDEPPYLDRIPV